MTPPALICPSCHGELISQATCLYCSPCGKEYPLRDKIPLFAPEMDSFYEGKFTQTHYLYPETVRRFPVLKSFWRLERMLNINARPYRVLNRLSLPSGGEFLDLGCGGGTEQFTRLGKVTGYDISLGSLQMARAVYPEVVQGNVLQLPFADNQFDGVLASHLIGHLPRSEKKIFLKEIIRILKPGGFLILFAETDADHFLFRFARQYPDLYQKDFIRRPGHLGLEFLPDLDMLIQSIGYLPVKRVKLYGFLWAVEHYNHKFSSDYGEQSRFFRGFHSCCRWLASRAFFRETADVLLGIVAPLVLGISSDRQIGEWFLAYQKPEK